MKSIFVDREPVFTKFDQFIRRQNPEWLLLIDGVEGIGKTAVLRQLGPKIAVHNRATHFNFASPRLSGDPVTILNRLASELPVPSFQQYTTALLKAYHGLTSAHLKTENSITVPHGSIFAGDIIQEAPGQFQLQETESDEKLRQLFVECKIDFNVEGIVSAEQIVQIVSVDLGQALEQLKQHIIAELTTRFVQIVDDYLAKRPDEQIILLADNVHLLQQSRGGGEHADWFLNELLATSHRRFPTRFRVVLTGNVATSWPEESLAQALRQALDPLSYEDTRAYLQQREINKERIIKGIYELSQGHPLCLALTADLYSLNPGLGITELQQYAPDPFDSGQLAHSLFQAIVASMPDEAMKKLLHYGPIFRVLDDDVIENILAVELGLTKDRLQDLLAELRQFAFFEEDSEVIMFRPLIQEQALAHLRQTAVTDPLYRALNRRAFQHYGQQWQHAVGSEKRRLKINMLTHEISLVPHQAEKILRREVEQTIQEQEFELAADIIDQTERVESTDIPIEVRQAWEAQLPVLLRRELIQPDSPVNKTTQSHSFSVWFAPLAGLWLLIVGSVRRAYQGIKHYITSPLRQLESHLRRGKRLKRLQQKIYKNLTRKQIPKIQHIHNQASQYSQQILTSELSGLANCQAANHQLANLVMQAVAHQNSWGSISPAQFNQISQQFTTQNRVVGQYNKKLRRFWSGHDQFVGEISNLNTVITDTDKQLTKMYQENEHLRLESQKLFQTGTAMIFTDDKEMPQAEKLMAAIEQNYNEINGNAIRVQVALDRYWLAQGPAVQAVNELHNAVILLNDQITATNQVIAPFNGTVLRCSDGRSLTIHNRSE